MNIILKKNFIFCLLLFYVACLSAQSPAYLNASIPVETRVQDLLGKMTLEEKASQINNTSPAITRLQIPAYNWWNEALHGVARAGHWLPLFRNPLVWQQHLMIKPFIKWA